MYKGRVEYEAYYDFNKNLDRAVTLLCGSIFNNLQDQSTIIFSF